MSINVSLPDLADEIDRRGPGFLLTSAANGRPHVMHVSFTTTGSDPGNDGTPVFEAPIGRSAAANIGHQADVTLLFPSPDHDGMSLIVDATATVAAGPATESRGTGSTATIVPVGAVLHRPA
jgi:hypothetical protein